MYILLYLLNTWGVSWSPEKLKKIKIAKSKGDNMTRETTPL